MYIDWFENGKELFILFAYFKLHQLHRFLFTASQLTCMLYWKITSFVIAFFPPFNEMNKNSKIISNSWKFGSLCFWVLFLNLKSAPNFRLEEFLIVRCIDFFEFPMDSIAPNVYYLRKQNVMYFFNIFFWSQKIGYVVNIFVCVYLFLFVMIKTLKWKKLLAQPKCERNFDNWIKIRSNEPIHRDSHRKCLPANLKKKKKRQMCKNNLRKCQFWKSEIFFLSKNFVQFFFNFKRIEIQNKNHAPIKQDDFQNPSQFVA